MKLLFVSDVSIQEVIGGAERVLYEQTTRLARRGHDVRLLTRYLADHRAASQLISGVEEWRYEIDPRGSIAFLLATLRNAKTAFKRIAGAHPIDLINIHQPFSAYPLLSEPTARGIKKIYTCLSFAFEEYQSRNRYPDNLVRRMLYTLHVWGRRHMEGRLLRRSERIIVLSRFTADKIANTYGIRDDRIATIPGGIDLVRFSPAALRDDIRNRHSLPPSRFILFTVRNLVARMGLENLVAAMKEIIKSVPEAFLVIGGTGPLRETLLQMIETFQLSNHVRLCGFIPEGDLPDYYRAADLFVLPTVELEGFGLVTLEALACGTPVLGTPIGGTSEILGELDRRFLFKDPKPESLATLIIATAGLYLDRPEQYRADAAKCRRFVQENYSWDKNVGMTEELFREVIQTRSLDVRDLR